MVVSNLEAISSPSVQCNLKLVSTGTLRFLGMFLHVSGHRRHREVLVGVRGNHWISDVGLQFRFHELADAVATQQTSKVSERILSPFRTPKADSVLP